MTNIMRYSFTYTINYRVPPTNTTGFGSWRVDPIKHCRQADPPDDTTPIPTNPEALKPKIPAAASSPIPVYSPNPQLELQTAKGPNPKCPAYGQT